MDDEAAVNAVLAGDPSAFDILVRRWQGPIVNLAYRFCRDRARAEDLAQEAFLRAYRGLRKWRREAAFSTWLFALATNVFRAEIRRYPPADAGQSEELEGVDPDTVEDRAARDQSALRVHRLVQSLPPRYRDVLVLFYFHDMDVSETAASLQVPEGTVKARLSRARDILRKRLTGPSDSAELGAPDATG